MNRLTLATTLALVALAGLPAAAGPRDDIIAAFATEAGQPLSAERGKALFMGKHSGGKPETPSCTTCHSNDPHAMGKTRVGKPIDPMAVSANPGRFTDPAFVAKWLRRNCTSVLGRECTATEAGDVLTYLSSI